MRPYLAIIKDSFREAMVSKLLWILMVICTGMLLTFVPLDMVDVYPDGIAAKEINNPVAMAEKLIAANAKGADAAHAIVRRYLDPEVTGNLALLANADADALATVLARNCSALLSDRDLAGDAGWQQIDLDDESTRLLEKGAAELESMELVQLNRRLLAAAFPEELELPESYACRIGYFSMYSTPFPQKRIDLLNDSIASFVVWTVGFVGIFLPILFTSPMIPRTFQAGAIDMLLSKPVSRGSVYLARFCGGCAFVVLISSYMVGGIFMICGFSFGYWAPRILLCIPVFIFNFAIYYSVSALIGVVWRNAVVAIFLTILFWLLCQ
ncbi:hypothetical protein BVY04_02510, partial [bacterium M21]